MRTVGRVLLPLAVVALQALTLFGCSKLSEMRLEGVWESDATPKRTLVLGKDGTYIQRFSGKTLGFLSEVLGPEAGRWHVEGSVLLLVRQERAGAETTRRVPFDALSSRSVLLAGERWRRLDVAPEWRDAVTGLTNGPRPSLVALGDR